MLSILVEDISRPVWVSYEGLSIICGFSSFFGSSPALSPGHSELRSISVSCPFTLIFLFWSLMTMYWISRNHEHVVLVSWVLLNCGSWVLYLSNRKPNALKAIAKVHKGGFSGWQRSMAEQERGSKDRMTGELVESHCKREEQWYFRWREGSYKEALLILRHSQLAIECSYAAKNNWRNRQKIDDTEKR